ncbi:hypothetical protein OSTOST_09049 [Ostertagia ostertagi]
MYYKALKYGVLLRVKIPAFPHERGDDAKALCAAPYMHKTDFVVEGYGSVPVINGDPKWLPIRVRAFLGFHTKLMRPAAIHICNGSFSEAEYLTATLEQMGVLEKLTGRDNVFVARTDPQDSTEKPVYICTTKLEDIEARCSRGNKTNLYPIRAL